MTTEFFSDSGWTDAELHIEQAQDFYEQGHWIEALRELQAAININPHYAKWYFNKGLTLDSLTRFSEATEAYRLAHDLDPHDPEVLNCLAVDYTRLGQYDLAIKAFEELEKIEPDFEPSYCNRIITYSEMGLHEKAEEMFYLARQLKDHCPFCYYNIGNSLFSRHQYDRAIWCWQQTRSLTPNHPQINYRIAQAHWAKGNLDKAKQSFLEELRNHPGDIDTLLDMGILLLEMNDIESAQEKFNRILEMDENQPQAHHYLGEIHLHHGRLPQATECFNRTITINPKQSGTHYRLGECYLKLGQLANARKHLVEELNVSPDQPRLLLDLGCLLEEVGEQTKAIHCFEQAIELDPNDPQGYQNLSLSYYLAGHLDEGIDLSHKVLELQPDHIAALHNLAFACLRKGQFAQARDYVNRATEKSPHDPQLKTLKRQITLKENLQQIKAPWQKTTQWLKQTSRKFHKQDKAQSFNEPRP